MNIWRKKCHRAHKDSAREKSTKPQYLLNQAFSLDLATKKRNSPALHADSRLRQNAHLSAASKSSNCLGFWRKENQRDNLKLCYGTNL
jgi:hypothetical protein